MKIHFMCVCERDRVRERERERERVIVYVYVPELVHFHMSQRYSHFIISNEI